MFRPGRNLRRFGAFLVGLLVASVLVEVGLTRWFPVAGQNYRLDPDLLHDALPGSSRLQLMPPGSDHRRVLVQINSSGLRGPEPDPGHRRPRVLLLGDSLVLAGNSPEEETLRAQLEGLFGGRVEVLNAGRESYGPDQTLLWFQREGAALAPELVIMVLCAHNDLGDLMRNKLFELGSDGSLVRRRPALGPSLRMRFVQRAEAARSPALLRWWRVTMGAHEPSLAVDPDRLVEAWYLAALQQHEDYISGDAVVRDLEHDTWDADVALVRDAASAKDKAALLTAVLVELQGALQITGSRSLALVVPSAVDLDPSYPIRPDSSKWKQYDPARLTARVVAAAEAAGWDVVDLTRDMHRAGPEGLFVGGEDIHWNARGQLLAAQVLVPRIESVLKSK
ncbi:MAG TPA: hypothetical protein EYQ25_01150 [Planctomycetes bacterium]|nr:hypothetical protein [Planctomycetota bacterium]HIL36281.1 hypothetical protein [Planctomycetota bacterium]